MRLHNLLMECNYVFYSFSFLFTFLSLLISPYLLDTITETKQAFHYFVLVSIVIVVIFDLNFCKSETDLNNNCYIVLLVTPFIEKPIRIIFIATTCRASRLLSGTIFLKTIFFSSVF